MTLNEFTTLAVVLLGPPVVAMWFMFWRMDRRAARGRWPILESSRRPAGESARLRLEELNEKLMFWMFMLLSIPTTMLVSGMNRPLPGSAVLILFLLTAVSTSVFASVRFWRVQSEYRNYLIGFEGERYAAGFLDELMQEGYDVFHDVPFTKFNIDHVLVGPMGIYAVETKTRRRRRGTGGGFKWKVTVREQELKFPWGAEQGALEQAERNARTMGTWVRQSSQEQVTAQAVLLLPGWLVDRRARGPVIVLNPKEARKALTGRPKILAPEVVERIAHQLREKSRIELGK